MQEAEVYLFDVFAVVIRMARDTCKLSLNEHLLIVVIRLYHFVFKLIT